MTAPPPARLAAAEAERLPEEIEKAIDALEREAFIAGIDDPCSAPAHARAALTATILTRLTAAEAARDAAVADQKAAEDANEALEVKLRALAPHGSCACSYDSPDDVCMHHSPALSAAVARAERLEGAVEEINRQIPYIAAQLRHAYSHLINGRAIDLRQFADGLLAPQIRRLETLASSDPVEET